MVQSVRLLKWECVIIIDPPIWLVVTDAVHREHGVHHVLREKKKQLYIFIHSYNATTFHNHRSLSTTYDKTSKKYMHMTGSSPHEQNRGFVGLLLRNGLYIWIEILDVQKMGSINSFYLMCHHFLYQCSAADIKTKGQAVILQKIYTIQFPLPHPTIPFSPC